MWGLMFMLTLGLTEYEGLGPEYIYERRVAPFV
jgi:hypothetical protein